MSLSTAVRNKVPGLRSLVRRFHSDRRGTIAIFIAAAAIPLIGALGLATDVARGYLVKSRLHQALDAAALAGGKDIDSDTRDADIQKFFTANFPSGYMDATLTPLVITPDADNSTLTVSASATVPTTFMRVLGFAQITVAAETEVKKVLSPALDVVLSMDLSGSMGMPMSKIEAAREAANDLVEALYGSSDTITATIDGTTYNILNIGLVPWNQTVNITERGKPAFAWLSTTDTTVSSYTNPHTNQTGRTHLYKPNSSPSVPLFSFPLWSWEGCVYARYDDDNNNSNDADLSIGLGMSMGIPGASGGTQNWVGYLPSYSGDCLSYPITPLQPSKSEIQDAIDELTSPNGATNIVQGLLWAWEVLMPGEPFDHGLASVPYPRNRAIVLLTDGQNYGSTDDAYHANGQSAFGTGTGAGTTTGEGNLPSPPAVSGTKNNLNNRLLLLSDFIKAQGITIYVVQFDEISQTLTDLLSEVASEPNEPYYFNAPTAEELDEAFNVIAGELSRLRLSR